MSSEQLMGNDIVSNLLYCELSWFDLHKPLTPFDSPLGTLMNAENIFTQNTNRSATITYDQNDLKLYTRQLVENYFRLNWAVFKIRGFRFIFCESF